MIPRIETIPQKKLVGKRMRMTLSNNRTFELWQSLMIGRKRIKNNVSTDLISLQVYDKSMHFEDFTPETEFEKWAVIEVTNLDGVPEGMETHLLTGGLYAVFKHKGLSSDFPKTVQYIFGTWLPQSIYELDQREHFEILGEKHRRNDPSSEEEVWIPIQEKTKPI